MTLTRRLFLAAALLVSALPAFAQTPLPVPALPDTERRTSYSLTNSYCNCAVNFALYGDSTDYWDWLEVWVNGTRVNYNDATYGWTITSPSGPIGPLPRPITDAVLAFNSPQTGTIQIVGARRPRRTFQFSENQGVPARSLNQALTDIVAQNRETWDRTNDITGRALLSPPGNTLGPLPSPSACANGFVGFDATGLNPLCRAGVGTGNVVGPATSTIGNLAVFGNTTGSRIADGGTPPATAVYNTKDYLSGTDFTAGTTTSLTLTTTPASNASVYIYFDGIRQSSNTYSIAGTTVTFNAAIPTNTQVVEINWSSVATIAGVVSFANRTGAVTPQFGDYTASMLAYTAPGVGAATRTQQSRNIETISVTDFGALDDGTDLRSLVTISSGSANLTCTSCLFTIADVNKLISITGAGTAGAPLVANILTFSDSTHVILSANASTTLSASAQQVSYGTDNSPFFQAAVNNNFASANHPSVVQVPCTQRGFMIGSTITMPIGGKLRGCTTANSSVQPLGVPSAITVGMAGGSVLWIVRQDVSPFVYNSGNSFEGLTIYYPSQLPTQTTPFVYPTTFIPGVIYAPITNVSWNNLIAVNPYSFILANEAGGHGDFRFTNIHGSPISSGIIDDGSFGTDYFRGIVFSFYYWLGFAAQIPQVAQNIQAWILANGTGITIGRIDELSAQDWYISGYNQGLSLQPGAVLANPDRGTYGGMVDISMEGNNYGIGCAATVNVGLQITNYRGAGNTNADYFIPSGLSTLCVVSFVNFSAWGPHQFSVLINSPTELQINGYRMMGASVAEISGPAGAVGSKLKLIGGTMDTQPTINISSTFNVLMLTNNFFGAAPSIVPPTNARYCGNYNLASSGC